MNHLKRRLKSCYHEGRPIVKAYPEQGTGFLTFWCDYCKKEHTHGRGNGHRTAHCRGYYNRSYRQVTTAEGSPFAKTGYFLNDTLVLGQRLPSIEEARKLWEQQ